MDLQQALLERLQSAAAVTALVANRISWMRRDQGASLPALVLTRISHVSEGDTLEDEGPIWTSRVQADCWARSLDEAGAVARAVRGVAVEPGDASGLDLFGGDVEGPIDFTEDAPDGPLFRSSLDLIIRHGEES